jgi:hypothetical protein
VGKKQSGTFIYYWENKSVTILENNLSISENVKHILTKVLYRETETYVYKKTCP